MSPHPAWLPRNCLRFCGFSPTTFSRHFTRKFWWIYRLSISASTFSLILKVFNIGQEFFRLDTDLACSGLRSKKGFRGNSKVRVSFKRHVFTLKFRVQNRVFTPSRSGFGQAPTFVQFLKNFEKSDLARYGGEAQVIRWEVDTHWDSQPVKSQL